MSLHQKPKMYQSYHKFAQNDQGVVYFAYILFQIYETKIIPLSDVLWNKGMSEHIEMQKGNAFKV